MRGDMIETYKIITRGEASPVLKLNGGAPGEFHHNPYPNPNPWLWLGGEILR